MQEIKVLGKERIGEFEFTSIEGGFGESKKAMLVKDIAEIHGTTVKRVNEVINKNLTRFIVGKDILDLKSKVVQNDLINFFGFEVHSARMSKNIYILSERGYAKLLKILEDDTAWKIYDELVDNYFEMRQQFKIPTSQRELAKLALSANEETNQRVDAIETDVKQLKTEITLTSSQKRKVRSCVGSTVAKALGGKNSLAYQDSSIRSTGYSDCYNQIQKYFDVSSYMDIPKIRYEETMSLIPKWTPNIELQAKIDHENGTYDIFDNY